MLVSFFCTFNIFPDTSVKVKHLRNAYLSQNGMKGMENTDRYAHQQQ